MSPRFNGRRLVSHLGLPTLLLGMAGGYDNFETSRAHASPPPKAQQSEKHLAPPSALKSVVTGPLLLWLTALQAPMDDNEKQLADALKDGETTLQITQITTSENPTPDKQNEAYELAKSLSKPEGQVQWLLEVLAISTEKPLDKKISDELNALAQKPISQSVRLEQLRARHEHATEPEDIALHWTLVYLHRLLKADKVMNSKKITLAPEIKDWIKADPLGFSTGNYAP